MKKCSSCNIEFNTSDKYCPLCQNILNGTIDELAFPKNIRLKTNSIILKIVLFASISAFLIAGFIELLLNKNINITLYFGLGLITNFTIIRLMLKNYLDFYRIFSRYGFLIILLLFIWFYVTKIYVITNYLIPIMCICELILNVIVSIILRKNYVVKYSGQVIMNVILAIIPIILVFFKFTTNNIMSYICCLLSIITFVGLLIFYYDDIKDELTKRLSI